MRLGRTGVVARAGSHAQARDRGAKSATLRLEIYLDHPLRERVLARRRGLISSQIKCFTCVSFKNSLHTLIILVIGKHLLCSKFSRSETLFGKDCVWDEIALAAYSQVDNLDVWYQSVNFEVQTGLFSPKWRHQIVELGCAFQLSGIRLLRPYSGTSLTRNRTHLRPYSRTMPTVLRRS